MGALNSLYDATLGRFRKDRYDDEYDSYEEYYDDDYEDDYEPAAKQEKARISRPTPKRYDNDLAYNATLEKVGASIVNIHKSEEIKMERRSPETLDQAKEICQLINENKVVIVDLTNVENKQRIADFVSGINHALEGKMSTLVEGKTHVFMVGSRHVSFGWGDEVEKHSRTFGTTYKY